MQNLNKRKIGLEEMRPVERWRKRGKYIKETVKMYATMMGILVIIVGVILVLGAKAVTDRLRVIKRQVKNILNRRK
tara:strand:- start:140 stop:367 length:228 start_codon:yes stop_codon:yes gene_type:complete